MRSSRRARAGIDPVTDVAGRFDGNPEWTYNPPPSCENRTVQVAFNGFVTIPLTCTDPPDPPTFAAKDPLTPEIGTPPASGNLGQVQSNNSVIYTPNANFTGTDTFTFSATDGTSPAPTATVTINVAPPQNGGTGADTTRPVVSGLSVSRKRFKRGSRLPSASQTRVGTTISFRLSEAGRATLSFQRARPGRRVGRRCVRPTRAQPHAARVQALRQGGQLQLRRQGGSQPRPLRGQAHAQPPARVRQLQGDRRAPATTPGNSSSGNPRASFTVVRR